RATKRVLTGQLAYHNGQCALWEHFTWRCTCQLFASTTRRGFRNLRITWSRNDTLRRRSADAWLWLAISWHLLKSSTLRSTLRGPRMSNSICRRHDRDIVGATVIHLTTKAGGAYKPAASARFYAWPKASGHRYRWRLRLLRDCSRLFAESTHSG